jgi:hypothetical protein
MSTDIIKFPLTNAQQDSDEVVFHSEALNLWLEVTVPSTLIVLAIWGVLVQLRTRLKKQEEIKKRENEKGKGNA